MLINWLTISTGAWSAQNNCRCLCLCSPGSARELHWNKSQTKTPRHNKGQTEQSRSTDKTTDSSDSNDISLRLTQRWPSFLFFHSRLNSWTKIREDIFSKCVTFSCYWKVTIASNCKPSDQLANCSDLFPLLVPAFISERRICFPTLLWCFCSSEPDLW